MKNTRDRMKAPPANEPEEEAETGYVSAPLLQVSEAAKYLGVGRKVFYQLIERGQITVVKSGGSTLVEKKSLDDFRARGILT